MQVYSSGNNFKLYNGNMLDVLSEIEPNSVDSIVTDPPYELGFMGKSWDSSGVSFQKSTWEKCYTVLKPGGHMLVFGGSRTMHRIACAIEDAGFEIRDTVMWIYGSGMPKSMNLGLAIDKRNGTPSEVVGYSGATMPDFQDAGAKNSVNKIGFNDGDTAKRIPQPMLKARNRWNGWGTTLKPAYEPILLCRKPCERTVIDNAVKWGVGGINIDECRIPLESGYTYKETSRNSRTDDTVFNNKSCGFNSENNTTASASPLGRFPANVILTYDESDFDEVCGGFPDSVGCRPHKVYSKVKSYDGWGTITQKNGELVGYDDCGGSTARYFYCAKASKRDRSEGVESCGIESNNHPTVKPTSLMQYLVRLITPKGGTILDPFTGSGSTGKAVMYENADRDANYTFVGVELAENYCNIATARIQFAAGDASPIETPKGTVPTSQEVGLFDL